MENLNIQVTVLRKLLDSEKERVSEAHREVKHMSAKIEDSISERNALKKVISIEMIIEYVSRIQFKTILVWIHFYFNKYIILKATAALLRISLQISLFLASIHHYPHSKKALAVLLHVSHLWYCPFYPIMRCSRNETQRLSRIITAFNLVLFSLLI